MLLALRFFLVLLLRRQGLVQIDLGEFVDQIRQHERVRIVWIKKNAALLGEIRFVRFFVDGEEQFFLNLKQFLLTRVLIKRKLGFIDFFFSSRRRHTRWTGDWSSDVCSSDLLLSPACSGRGPVAPRSDWCHHREGV